MESLQVYKMRRKTKLENDVSFMTIGMLDHDD